MVPNQWLRKCLASGIIFLFVGIAVQPITAISITQLNELEYIHNFNSFYREEDCHCEDGTAQDIVEVNRVLDKTESIIKIILLTYGSIPDITLMCNRLLTLFDAHGNHGLICTLLGALWIGTFLIWMDIGSMKHDFNENGRHILANICQLLYDMIEATIIIPVLLISVFLNCHWTLYPEMTLGPNSLNYKSFFP